MTSQDIEKLELCYKYGLTNDNALRLIIYQSKQPETQFVRCKARIWVGHWKGAQCSKIATCGDVCKAHHNKPKDQSICICEHCPAGREKRPHNNSWEHKGSWYDPPPAWLPDYFWEGGQNIIANGHDEREAVKLN
jgi:hypothetical protein